MDFDLTSFISVVGSLMILEALLSVDNALANAAIASRLKDHRRYPALRIGIILGAVFRILALLGASLIINNRIIKTLAALYLLVTAIRYLLSSPKRQHSTSPKTQTFKGVIAQIAITDAAFSVDNVITAVGLSEKIGYVIAGVLIGIAVIVVLSQSFIKIIDRFPAMTKAAYIIMALIGLSLLYEEYAHHHIHEIYKFSVVIAIVVISAMRSRANTKGH